MKEHQWTVDVCLSLEALLLPWYYNNLATEACVSLFGVQPTSIAFSSPQGGKGPIGPYFILDSIPHLLDLLDLLGLPIGIALDFELTPVA